QFYGLPADIAACRAYLRERLAHGESRVYLACRDAKAVGFMQLYPSFGSLSLRRVWVLYDLFVAPEARRHGVATRLLEQARRLGLDTGANELTLATAADNLNAQRLYERMGWKRDLAFYYYSLRI
ncbi:MAG: GNAT family N-acetyltransferase, partial [Proteobacteria bacterium]|nr:GNAT family N-acetyltransferase [Pseudomonadota bacterium]